MTCPGEIDALQRGPDQVSLKGATVDVPPVCPSHCKRAEEPAGAPPPHPRPSSGEGVGPGADLGWVVEEEGLVLSAAGQPQGDATPAPTTQGLASLDLRQTLARWAPARHGHALPDDGEDQPRCARYGRVRARRGPSRTRRDNGRYRTQRGWWGRTLPRMSEPHPALDDLVDDLDDEIAIIEDQGPATRRWVR